LYTGESGSISCLANFTCPKAKLVAGAGFGGVVLGITLALLVSYILTHRKRIFKSALSVDLAEDPVDVAPRPFLLNPRGEGDSRRGNYHALPVQPQPGWRSRTSLSPLSSPSDNRAPELGQEPRGLLHTLERAQRAPHSANNSASNLLDLHPALRAYEIEPFDHVCLLPAAVAPHIRRNTLSPRNPSTQSLPLQSAVPTSPPGNQVPVAPRDEERVPAPVSPSQDTEVSERLPAYTPGRVRASGREDNRRAGPRVEKAAAETQPRFRLITGG